jgi:hypothetical protein
MRRKSRLLGLRFGSLYPPMDRRAFSPNQRLNHNPAVPEGGIAMRGRLAKLTDGAKQYGMHFCGVCFRQGMNKSTGANDQG